MPRTISDPSRGAKRYPLSLRTTEGLREKLRDAARISGRSVAQEVEGRLERSFDRETVAAELFGSTDARDLVQAVSTIIRHVDRYVAKNPKVFAAVNDVPQYNLDQILQTSAAIIAFLQALNLEQGMPAAEILARATDARHSATPWLEAATAATAQALGIAVDEAAKRVVNSAGDIPLPKEPLEWLGYALEGNTASTALKNAVPASPAPTPAFKTDWAEYERVVTGRAQTMGISFEEAAKQLSKGEELIDGDEQQVAHPRLHGR